MVIWQIGAFLVKRFLGWVEHCTKDGTPKILKKCTLPLTGKGRVSMIVTELGVFYVKAEGLVLSEIAFGVDIETVRAKTEAPIIISSQLKTMTQAI